MLWVEDKVQWRGVNWNLFFAIGIVNTKVTVSTVVHYSVDTCCLVPGLIRTVISQISFLTLTTKVTAINTV